MISLPCDRLANIAIPITVAARRGHRGRLDYSYAEEGGTRVAKKAGLTNFPRIQPSNLLLN